MSQFMVNPADERSIQVLVAERQERARSAARRDSVTSERDGRSRSLRRAFGQQVIRLGAWISGVSAPGEHARLGAS